MNWSEYFYEMANLVAKKSKDQSTQIGAVIVGPDNEIRSTGYNSFQVVADEYPNHRLYLKENYCILLNEFRYPCLLYTSPSPRDRTRSRMPSSA